MRLLAAVSTGPRSVPESRRLIRSWRSDDCAWTRGRKDSLSRGGVDAPHSRPASWTLAILTANVEAPSTRER